MKLHVRFIPQNTSQQVDIKKGSTVLDVLRLLQKRPDSVLVLQNKTSLPIDDVVENDYELSIVQVASGG